MNEHSFRPVTKFNARPRAGFTLIELLVVIGIIGVLAVIALPIYGRVTRQGHITVTTSNIRQMGMAFMLYAQDNNFQLPGRVTDQAPDPDAKKWPALLQPYYQDLRVLISPIDPVAGVTYKETDPVRLLGNTANFTSYIANGYNDIGDKSAATIQPRINNVGDPTNTILLGIPLPHMANYYLDLKDKDQDTILNRKAFGDMSIYAFADGSVRSLQYVTTFGGANVDMNQKPPSSGIYTDWLWLMDKANPMP